MPQPYLQLALAKNAFNLGNRSQPARALNHGTFAAPPHALID